MRDVLIVLKDTSPFISLLFPHIVSCSEGLFTLLDDPDSILLYGFNVQYNLLGHLSAVIPIPL